MKKSQVYLEAIYGVLFTIVVSVLLFAFVGVPMWATATVLILIALFVPRQNYGLTATVYREAWAGELMKYLTNADNGTFLQGIPDYSRYVSSVGSESVAIHLAAMNVLPDVLVDNTAYPIPMQSLNADDVIIQLKKFQTKRTPITDDELFGLTIDKMAAIVQRHGLSIAIEKYKRALHSLAPSGATAKMPVITTTGADDGTGRKRMTWDDIVSLKRALNNLDLPEDDFRLVLCKDHVNDLISNDQRFQNQYYNRADGKPYSQLGFEIMDHVCNPYFNPVTKVKLTYGAIPAVTDRKASIFYCLNRTAQATGWTKMYYKQAAISPDTQQSEINFRTYHIALPTEEAARGAIVSANV